MRGWAPAQWGAGPTRGTEGPKTQSSHCADQAQPHAPNRGGSFLLGSGALSSRPPCLQPRRTKPQAQPLYHRETPQVHAFIYSLDTRHPQQLLLARPCEGTMGQLHPGRTAPGFPALCVARESFQKGEGRVDLCPGLEQGRHGKPLVTTTLPLLRPALCSCSGAGVRWAALFELCLGGPPSC